METILFQNIIIITIMMIDLIRITITAWSPILQISFSLLRALAWDSDAATPVHQVDQHEHEDDQHQCEDDQHEDEDDQHYLHPVISALPWDLDAATPVHGYDQHEGDDNHFEDEDDIHDLFHHQL